MTGPRYYINVKTICKIFIINIKHYGKVYITRKTICRCLISTSDTALRFDVVVWSFYIIVECLITSVEWISRKWLRKDEVMVETNFFLLFNTLMHMLWVVQWQISPPHFSRYISLYLVSFWEYFWHFLNCPISN